MAQTLYPPVARSRVDLSHIPGEDGWPVLGQTLQFLMRPVAMPERLYARYGEISRGNVMFENAANLLGPDANQFVLADREGNFSAYRGWTPILGDLFPRGLMLRDGADHRSHRRIMQTAFRKEALAADLALMQPLIAERLARWPQRLKFYPAIKSLTLDLAASVFLDLPLGRDAARVNRAFVNVVEASMSVLQLPVPGTLYGRGLRGRAFLERFFAARIPGKRAAPGNDLFSRLCTAESEEGERYSDGEIVDHMIFLMMAAHDTTTSALTTLAYLLAANPDWQARLREEAMAAGPDLEHADLDALPDAGRAFREALRLYPPLPSMRRRTVRECEFKGHTLPADTAVNIFNHFTHHMPEYWDDPERFDPDRFARNEHRRHPFQFIPFGAGAHTCIGLHFAEIQVKAVLHRLLREYRLSVPPGYRMPYQIVPISKPRDGLPLTLAPVGAPG
ncbi:cytochrome P450 [Salinisphaera sp. PC39]|uniref:cytochrome P450 n=1 Tax=Salinisphaera sp. PC39 TaxID=1304156 RepID=UPI00333F1A23